LSCLYLILFQFYRISVSVSVSCSYRYPSITECNTNYPDELSTRAEILQKLASNLQKAQAAMKKWADQHRRDLQFGVDDWVYIRLHPRRQSSATSTTSGKLMKRFFGPFKITRRIGDVAYAVDPNPPPPPTTKVHNTFHVSLLCPHKGLLPSFPLPLPPNIEDDQPPLLTGNGITGND